MELEVSNKLSAFSKMLVIRLLCFHVAGLSRASLDATLELSAADPSVPFRRLWRTQVKPCSTSPTMGFPNWITKGTALIDYLPVPPTFAAGQDKTLLFTERVSRVRLLGGWKGGPGAASGDFVSISSDGSSFTADWNELYARLDPIVDANLSLVIVFDNIPWVFVRNATRVKTTGPYGNTWGPDEVLKPVFVSFINATIIALTTKYGQARVAEWMWRISTEPNCPCHWLDSIDNWLWMYIVIASAVRGIIGPNAILAPANFPRGMQMNVVHDINVFLADNITQSLMPDVLGVSYYGGSPGGYRASDLIGTTAWMRGYANAIHHSSSSKTKVHIMEYGTLENYVHQRSNEPGIFGTAWTLNGWVVALNPASTIEETYHWTAMDYVDSTATGSSGNPLLFGWAWLLALGDLMVGGDATVVRTSMPFTTDRNHTSIAAIASRFDDALYIAVSAFGSYAYNASSQCDECGHVYATTLAIENAMLPKQLQLKLMVPGGNDSSNMNIGEWSLNTTSSWYDEIWRDLAEVPGGLDSSAKNYVYQLSKMRSKTVGKAYLEAHFKKYDAMQVEALQSAPFRGDVVSRNATHLVLGFQMSAPEVRVLKIT
tara:strand:+ start:39 stop:1838 length:1800 start_codon:yes stop_codon:yes gene_type:complete